MLTTPAQLRLTSNNPRLLAAMIPCIVKWFADSAPCGARIINEVSRLLVEVRPYGQRVVTDGGSCKSTLAINDDGFEEPSKVSYVGLPCSSALSCNGIALRRSRIFGRRPKTRLPRRRGGSACSCSRRATRTP